MSWTPPRPRRKAGETFWEWLANLPPSRWVTETINGIAQRAEHWFSSFTKLFFLKQRWMILGLMAHMVFLFAPYVILGLVPARYIDFLVESAFQAEQNMFSILGQFAAEAIKNRSLDPLAQAIAGVLFDEIKEKLGSGVKDVTLPPEASGREMAKAMATISLRNQMTSAVLSHFIPELGQVIAQALNGTYWALGLGFLSWQALAPLLSNAVQKPQENYLNYHFPKEFPPPSAAARWFAQRLISEGELFDILRYHGIIEKYHDNYKKDAYSRISPGDLFTLYENGLIDQSTLASYLAALGFADEDIPLIIRARTLPKEEPVPEISLSVLRQALREGIISEEEFRQRARQIPRNPDEIELIIQIERLRKGLQQRLLTVGQIKEAFRVGTLKEPEVVHYLKELGLRDEQINVLIQTWKEEFKPTFRVLNAERLTQAFMEGVITENDLFNRLLLLGWDEESVRIWIDTVKAKLGRRETRDTTERLRKPTTSQVLTFMLDGIISQQEAFDLLLDIGYDETTAKRLIQSALLSPPKPPKRLSVAQVIEAWRKGFLTTAEALDRLQEMDYTPEDAETLLYMEGPSLGESDLLRAWRAGWITTEQFIEGAVRAGYRRADVVRLVKWLNNPIELNEIVTAYRTGVLTREEAERALRNQGYPEADIQRVLEVS